MIKRTLLALTALVLCALLFACHPADAGDTTDAETKTYTTDGITTDMNTSSAETEPVTTTPPETEPATTTPPETEPVTTTPPETEPVTTTPPETEPETTTPPETEPVTTTPPETEPVTTTPPETEPETTTPPETEPLLSADEILGSADDKYSSYTSFVEKHTVSAASGTISVTYGAELRKSNDSRSFTAKLGGDELFLAYKQGSAYYGESSGYCQQMTVQVFDALIESITGIGDWTFASSSYVEDIFGGYTVVQSGAGEEFIEYIDTLIRKAAGLDDSASISVRQIEIRHTIDENFNRTKKVITVKTDITLRGITLPVTCTVTSDITDVNSAVSTLSPADNDYIITDSLVNLIKVTDAYKRYCDYYKGTGGYTLTESAVIFDGLTREYSSENTVAFNGNSTDGKYYFSSDITENNNGTASSLVSYYDGTRLAYKENGGDTAYDNTVSADTAKLTVQTLMTNNFGSISDMVSFSTETEGGIDFCVFDLDSGKYGRDTLLSVFFDFTGENPAADASVIIDEFSGRIRLDTDGSIADISWIISGEIDCGGGLTYDVTYINTVVTATEGSSVITVL